MKYPANKKKGASYGWEKIFANHLSDEGLIPKVPKELSKLNGEKTIGLEMVKTLRDTSPRGM